MWIIMVINLLIAGLNKSAPTELAMMVIVSTACPRNCLYSLLVWVSIILKSNWTVTSKNGLKFYLHISATDEIAPRQLSLTKEIPELEWKTRSSIISLRCTNDSSYFKPYKKLVRAAAEWDTTLGIGSFKSWTNFG